MYRVFVGGSDAPTLHRAWGEMRRPGQFGLVSTGPLQGGAPLISGLVLLASAPGDDAAQHARVRVAPPLVLARNGTLLGAAGAF